MKKTNKTLFFLSLFLLASCSASRKSLPALENGKVGIQETISFSENVSIIELMSRARLFFAENYRTTNVIQLDDPNSGIIIGRPSTRPIVNKLGMSASYDVFYRIKIECKPGRYRYTIDDVYVQGANNAANLYGTKIPAEKYWSMIMGKKPGTIIGKTIKSAASQLKDAMGGQIQSNDKNW